MALFGKRRINPDMHCADVDLSDFVFFDLECDPLLDKLASPRQAGVCLFDGAKWITRLWNRHEGRFVDFLGALLFDFQGKTWVHWDGPEFEITREAFFATFRPEECSPPLFLDAREVWKYACESGLLGSDFPRNGGGKPALSLSSALMFMENRKQTHNALKDAIDTRDVLVGLIHSGWKPEDIARTENLREKAVRKIHNDEKTCRLFYIAVAKGASPGVHSYRTREERSRLIAKVVGNGKHKGKISWREFGKNQREEAEAWFRKNAPRSHGFLTRKDACATPEASPDPANKNDCAGKKCGILERAFLASIENTRRLSSDESYVSLALQSSGNLEKDLLDKGIRVGENMFGPFENDLFSSEMYARRKLAMKMTSLVSILVGMMEKTGVEKAVIKACGSELAIRRAKCTTKSDDGGDDDNANFLLLNGEEYPGIVEEVSDLLVRESGSRDNSVSETERFARCFSNVLDTMLPRMPQSKKIRWETRSRNGVPWEMDWSLEATNKRRTGICG